MKIARKALGLVLALVLMLSMAAFSAAQADTIVKSVHGAFAAEEKLLGRIFMILPTDAGSSLYSMPAQGGTVTLIESAQQINDVIAAFLRQMYGLQDHEKSIQEVLNYYGINLKNYEVYNSVNETLQLVKQKRM